MELLQHAVGLNGFKALSQTDAWNARKLRNDTVRKYLPIVSHQCEDRPNLRSSLEDSHLLGLFERDI